MEKNRIPDCLVFNLGETELNIISSANYTMEQKGTKKIKIAGLDSKRQISGVICVAKTGEVLPPQQWNLNSDDEEDESDDQKEDEENDDFES